MRSIQSRFKPYSRYSASVLEKDTLWYFPPLDGFSKRPRKFGVLSLIMNQFRKSFTKDRVCASKKLLASIA